MRIRRKPWARPELEKCDFFINDAAEHKGNWASLFKNKSPINLELGCGKGEFIANISFKNPNTNYIAIDIKSEMLACACRNIKKLFLDKPINNVLLTALDIQRIDLALSKEDIVERIYINFCNPWPKKKHKKRRLTYPLQLVKYKEFLKNSGDIYFKTDDDELFEDSVNYFLSCGFDIIYKTNDLHKENLYFNILTEHEKMFMEQGCKIKFLIARKEGNYEKNTCC